MNQYQKAMPAKEDLYSLKRKSNFLTIRDVWYDDHIRYDDADMVYYMQMLKPIGEDFYEQYTILINLNLDKETLYSKIGKNCRLKINSVISKNNCLYEFHAEPNSELLSRFIDDFNEFAAFKQIQKVDQQRLNSYLKNNLITVSCIKDETGEIIVWHVYRTNSKFCYLIYTISATFKTEDSKIKNSIGMANRYCHWMDILSFKNLGIGYYDFGGWYNGNEDQEKLGINKFKEEFGGAITENYNSITYPTWKGKFIRLLKKFKRT